MDPTKTSSQRELISFRAGDQEFCVDIMEVREIRGWTAATPLPDSPDYLRGVINLRGAVLPIVDLGARLGFPQTQETARHAIIVVQVEDQAIGLLVEGVSDVLTVDAANIQPPPDLALASSSGLVLGMLATDGRMITLLSVAAVLSARALAGSHPREMTSPRGSELEAA